MTEIQLLAFPYRCGLWWFRFLVPRCGMWIIVLLVFELVVLFFAVF